MTSESEIKDFLYRHLNTIMESDLEGYHATTHEDLTLYEWWVTPHRLDGLPFHDFMMTESARIGRAFGTGESEDAGETNTRLDLSNLKIQLFGDTAIASYTMLVSTGSLEGVSVAAHNESRVMVKINGSWQVVHVHKSPAWDAPHSPQRA
jgi:hypothetical protein